MAVEIIPSLNIHTSSAVEHTTPCETDRASSISTRAIGPSYTESSLPTLSAIWFEDKWMSWQYNAARCMLAVLVGNVTCNNDIFKDKCVLACSGFNRKMLSFVFFLYCQDSLDKRAYNTSLFKHCYCHIKIKYFGIVCLFFYPEK